MRIIALKTLRLFWEQHPDAQQALQAWYRDAKRAIWSTPADIKNVYRNASIVGNNRQVFNQVYCPATGGLVGCGPLIDAPPEAVILYVESAHASSVSSE